MQEDAKTLSRQKLLGSWKDFSLALRSPERVHVVLAVRSDPVSRVKQDLVSVFFFFLFLGSSVLQVMNFSQE